MRLIGAFLLLFMGTTVFAAEPTTSTPTEEIPWYRRVFLGERTKPMPPKPVVVAKPVPQSRESIARAFEQEQEVYLQRLAAISKIREVAIERDDEEMLKKAAELEKNADELFKVRTMRLKNDSMEADRAALERQNLETSPATAERPSQRRRPTREGNN